MAVKILLKIELKENDWVKNIVIDYLEIDELTIRMQFKDGWNTKNELMIGQVLNNIAYGSVDANLPMYLIPNGENLDPHSISRLRSGPNKVKTAWVSIGEIIKSDKNNTVFREDGFMSIYGPKITVTQITEGKKNGYLFLFEDYTASVGYSEPK